MSFAIAFGAVLAADIRRMIGVAWVAVVAEGELHTEAVQRALVPQLVGVQIQTRIERSTLDHQKIAEVEEHCQTTVAEANCQRIVAAVAVLEVEEGLR